MPDADVERHPMCSRYKPAALAILAVWGRLMTSAPGQDQAWEHKRAFPKHAQQAVVLCTDMSQAGSCSNLLCSPCVWPEVVRPEVLQPEMQAKDAELAALRARLGQVEGLQAAEDQLAGMAGKAAELKVGQPAQSLMQTGQPAQSSTQTGQNLVAIVASRAAAPRPGADA